MLLDRLGQKKGPLNFREPRTTSMLRIVCISKESFVFLFINGINQLTNGINRSINGITRLINGMTRLIRGINRLIHGWGDRPGPPGPGGAGPDLGQGPGRAPDHGGTGRAPQPLISRVMP